MPHLPKLKVRYNTEDESRERTLELEQARGFYYGSEEGHALVLMEGQAVYSYEELIELANQDSCRDRDFLKVELRWFVIGGG